MLARAGAWFARVAESDGATGQAVCRTLGFRPPRVLHAYWCGRATRPIFDHREAEVRLCRWPRTGCERVSDGAPAQLVRRLPRFGKLALQLAPVAFTQECSSHLCTSMTSQTVRDSSKNCFHGQFGRLTRECRALATRRAYTHPIGHVHLVQRISILGIEGREARWSGDSEQGTANERRRHPTAIRELTR